PEELEVHRGYELDLPQPQREVDRLRAACRQGRRAHEPSQEGAQEALRRLGPGDALMGAHEVAHAVVERHGEVEGERAVAAIVEADGREGALQAAEAPA